MAIIKRIRKNGRVTYQVKVRDQSGNWLPGGTHHDFKSAKKLETKLFAQSSNGKIVNKSHDKTVDNFFHEWIAFLPNISDGWRKDRKRDYLNYVSPVLGAIKLRETKQFHIQTVLRKMEERGRAEQTRLHIYNLLNRLMSDAVENEFLDKSPISKKFKPQIPYKEANYLTKDQSLKLLTLAKGHRFESAIWLGIVLGLRVGEVISLKWSDVNLDSRTVLIRSTYVRKEGVIKDFPKGRRQNTLDIPEELFLVLKNMSAQKQSLFVCPGHDDSMLSYHVYYRALRKLCTAAGVPVMASHGLRHSMAELWISSGGSRETIQSLLNHSSTKVTDRYIHGGKERLKAVTGRLRLLPDPDVPKIVPICSHLPLDPTKEVC